MKEFKEIRIVEVLLNQPEEVGGISEKHVLEKPVKKVYIDGKYVGNAETVIFQYPDMG